MSNVKFISEYYPESMLVDGFDECIIGICHRIGQEAIVAYGKGQVIAKLMAEGLDEEEAYEHFDYNIIGSFVGEQTPCFIEFLREGK